MFRMGLVHARDNGQGVSGTELKRTARYGTYCTPEQEQDVTAPTGIGPGLMVQQAGKGVGVPVHPTEEPGGLQVESKYMTARHYNTIINLSLIHI